MKRNTPLLIATGIVAALLGALLARGLLTAPPANLANGTVLKPAQALPAFHFMDHNKATFDNTRLNGKWSLLFFGFTNCGDVCPTTMAMLAGVAQKLADLPKGQQPQVVFISVDAQRDTPEVLSTYVKSFNPDFVGVTGAQSDLNAFTKAIGIPSAIRPLAHGYAVDHSAAIVVIDPQARFHAIFTPPQTADGIAGDYRLLLASQ